MKILSMQIGYREFKGNIICYLFPELNERKAWPNPVILEGLKKSNRPSLLQSNERKLYDPIGFTWNILYTRVRKQRSTICKLERSRCNSQPLRWNG